MATITLNAAARKLGKFADTSKVRTEVREGVMFILPTIRASRVNLSKDKHLVDLKNGKISIEGMDHAAGTYGLREEKYGWYALVPGHQGSGPSAKIA